jgi:hypothetical protein
MLPELFVDGTPELLVWAVNNISNIKGSEPLIAPAVRAAQALGWPTDIPETEKVPMNPPFTWDYTGRVQDPGGPGPAVGSLAQAVVQFEEGQVVEIVLQNARALNGAAEFHPWHSHGHSFWVVGCGDGIFNAEADPALYNLENPVLRDTVNLWPLQWVALRFVANNPGVWFFHCHITAHLMMGMALTMVVQPDVLEDPSDSVRYCQETGLEPGDDIDSDDGETTSHGVKIKSGLLGTALSLAWVILL